MRLGFRVLSLGFIVEELALRAKGVKDEDERSGVGI